MKGKNPLSPPPSAPMFHTFQLHNLRASTTLPTSLAESLALNFTVHVQKLKKT